MRTCISSTWGLAVALPLLLGVGVARAQVAPRTPAAEKPVGAPQKEARTAPQSQQKKGAAESPKVGEEPGAEAEPRAAVEQPGAGTASDEVAGSDSAPEEAGQDSATSPDAKPSPAGDIDLSAGEGGAAASVTASSAAHDEVSESEEEGPKAAAEPKEPQPEEPRPDYVELPWTHHMQHLDLMVGLRLNSALDDGLEPFLESPVFAQAVGRFGGVIFSSQPLALAVLGELGGSSVGAGARGADTNLSLFHMGAGVEGRYFLHPRVYGYARLMAGAEAAWMRYSDFDQEATDSGWAFTGDGVLGAAVRVIGSPDGRNRSARVWLFGEGGYRYSTAHEVKLEFDESTGPTRAQPLVFDDFATSGFMGSFGLMVTY